MWVRKVSCSDTIYLCRVTNTLITMDTEMSVIVDGCGSKFSGCVLFILILLKPSCVLQYSTHLHILNRLCPKFVTPTPLIVFIVGWVNSTSSLIARTLSCQIDGGGA